MLCVKTDLTTGLRVSAHGLLKFKPSHVAPRLTAATNPNTDIDKHAKQDQVQAGCIHSQPTMFMLGMLLHEDEEHLQLVTAQDQHDCFL